MRKRRLIVWCLAVAVLIGGGAYVINEQLRACSLLDVWLRRSGCIAAHEFSNLFDGKSLNNPAMAFEGDSDRLALAMTETQPATAAGVIPQRYTLLEVSAESGMVRRRTPLGGFEEGRLNGAILLSWNGRHAVMAVPQPGKVAAKDQVAATLRLMPLIGSDPGWEKPMDDIPTSRSGFGQFDPDNQRFRLFTKAWTIAGEQIDRGQVNWNKALGSSDMPVNMPDGTTAVVRTNQGVIEIVQADGRRSSHELGIDKQQISTNWLLLSPDGHRLSLILRPVEADGILQVWDIRTGQRLIDATVPGLATEAAWSADGRRLAVRRDGREGSGYAVFAIGD
ncbi:hypothetical protein FZC33_21535 [Labrys sp. KNU-23]|uniref:WD40 repeat domain-containing protein n=1 Tax=Labrys sp. KNU-23 TaxID=2789216 RepID=UPI0011EE5C2F|nr:WD40 repeat domain-containing protein [Labrys sp. KNU-23]QEN88722.1 hypothetical protein FZC33_21535 [Labrys sp. KNU-23]